MLEPTVRTAAPGPCCARAANNSFCEMLCAGGSELKLINVHGFRNHLGSVRVWVPEAYPDEPPIVDGFALKPCPRLGNLVDVCTALQDLLEVDPATRGGDFDRRYDVGTVARMAEDVPPVRSRAPYIGKTRRVSILSFVIELVFFYLYYLCESSII